MPLSFMKDSVVVLRASIGVKNGMEFRDWDNADHHTINNVLVTAQSTMRDFDGRLGNVTDRYTLRAKFIADIKPGDRIVWRGHDYEVDGEVFHTQSPTGRVASTRCTLVRWEG